MKFEHLKLLVVSSIILLAASCRSYDIPDHMKSENGHFQAVIEIPAGSTNLEEYDFESKSFNSSEEVQIPFLPFPGNYGFIPGTSHPASDKGTGAALDVLVLSGMEEQGSVMEILPIAMLKLQRNGKYENKVIAVPVDSVKNTLDVKNYFEFQRDHYLCKNILMEWFLHVYQSDTIIFIGWENEKVTKGEIERRKIY
jgi:inorganic pyrophosphatase